MKKELEKILIDSVKTYWMFLETANGGNKCSLRMIAEADGRMSVCVSLLGFEHCKQVAENAGQTMPQVGPALLD